MSYITIKLLTFFTTRTTLARRNGFLLCGSTSDQRTLGLGAQNPAVNALTRPTRVHHPGVVVLVRGLIVHAHRLQLRHGRTLRAAVFGRLLLHFPWTLQHRTGVPAAVGRAIPADARRAVVGRELFAVLVEALAQQAAALNRVAHLTLLTASRATFARHLDLLGRRTVQHRTRHFDALQPAALALAL